jgi:hypothetical protein
LAAGKIKRPTKAEVQEYLVARNIQHIDWQRIKWLLGAEIQQLIGSRKNKKTNKGQSSRVSRCQEHPAY